MIKVHVNYFQALRKVAGLSEECLDLPAGATLADLLAHVAAARPELADHLPSLLLAVNEQMAERSQPLHEGDRVALMPPFSGG